MNRIHKKYIDSLKKSFKVANDTEALKKELESVRTNELFNIKMAHVEEKKNLF